MNMDSPNNIVSIGSDNVSASQWRRNKLAGHVETDRGDATVRSEYEHIIQKALNAEPDGAQVMETERVRVELQDGLLDTPAAVKTAAVNILLFGI